MEAARTGSFLSTDRRWRTGRRALVARGCLAGDQPAMRAGQRTGHRAALVSIHRAGRPAGDRRRQDQRYPPVPLSGPHCAAQDQVGAASERALRRVVRRRVRRAALRPDQHLCGRRGGKQSDGAPRLFAGSQARLRATGDRADCEQRRFPLQLRNLRRQPRRRLDHGDDPAHGGTQVWEGAKDLGVRSRHRERGESCRDPQTRGPVSDGHAAQPDETV